MYPPPILLEKKRRVLALRSLDARMRERFLSRLVGTTADVLVETADPVKGELSGRSANYAVVVFPGAPSDVGEVHRVAVEYVRDGRLAGTRS